MEAFTNEYIYSPTNPAMMLQLSWAPPLGTVMDPIKFFGNQTFEMVYLGASIIGPVAGAPGCSAHLCNQSVMTDVIVHSARPRPYWPCLPPS